MFYLCSGIEIKYKFPISSFLVEIKKKKYVTRLIAFSFEFKISRKNMKYNELFCS